MPYGGFYLECKCGLSEWFPSMPLFSRSYLKCITFLASFETLNIPITYELFCNSPKEGMIKGLWKNHSHESMVRTWSCLRVGASSSLMCSYSRKCLKPEKLFIPEQAYCSETVSPFLSWQVTRSLEGPLHLCPWRCRAWSPPPTRGHFCSPFPGPVCPHPVGEKRLSPCQEGCSSSFSSLPVGIQSLRQLEPRVRRLQGQKANGSWVERRQWEKSKMLFESMTAKKKKNNLSLFFFFH